MRVTFFFTDVEGSTRLLREHGDEYAELLADHREKIRGACARHAGREVDTQGDAFFFVFDSPCDAIAAAAEAQSGLESGAVRVRIGIHTGEVLASDEGYVGLELHKAARIAAAAHGGQTIVSSEARGEVTEDFDLIDLGEHRVKDFDEAISLHQLGTTSFPPLRTLANTNLPRPASSFVGRAPEVQALRDLMRSGNRLVTVTGPGGSGKTRLAIESAAELQGDFRAGVFWVGLTTVTDGALVLEQIGRMLGARGDLASHIGARELALVLDNLEQAIDAAPALADLVERCENLQLLVTSRELLRVRGEVEFALEPLSDGDAVELFWERARVEEDRDTAVALCRALDNLPLAVELAAARAGALTAGQMLERIGQRLDLLKGGRDAQPRHRTLRATIDWSYDLLQPEEQLLFGQLSLFPGGCTLEAAERIVAADLDTLQALVEKSLVRHTGDRFWMLGTIRSYSVELRVDDDDDLNTRFAEYFLALVESSEPELVGPRQAGILRRLEADYPNIRAALAHFEAAGDGERMLRLATALRRFFFKKGYLSEGRRSLLAALAVGTTPSPARARALSAAALLATLQLDYEETERLASEARLVGVETGATEAAAAGMLVLGRALLAREPEAAVALMEDARRLAAETGDGEIEAMAVFNLAYAALAAGDLSSAERRFAEAAQRPDIDPYIAARALAALGSVALRGGRPEEAEVHLRRALALLADLEQRDDTLAWALELLGAALAGSEPERAAELLREADELRQQLGLTLAGLELEQHEQAVATLETS